MAFLESGRLTVSDGQFSWGEILKLWDACKFLQIYISQKEEWYLQVKDSDWREDIQPCKEIIQTKLENKAPSPLKKKTDK